MQYLASSVSRMNHRRISIAVHKAMYCCYGHTTIQTG